MYILNEVLVNSQVFLTKDQKWNYYLKFKYKHINILGLKNYDECFFTRLIKIKLFTIVINNTTGEL